MDSIKVEYLTYTIIYFNNPNHRCLECNAWAPGFFAGKRKTKLWPCGHKSDFKSECPTWAYTTGCTCIYTSEQHNIRHLRNADEALLRVNSGSKNNGLR